MALISPQKNRRNLRVPSSHLDPSSPHPDWLLPFLVSTGCLLIYFIRFGYGYGSSDQDELLPFLLHRLNPQLFTEDWFVQLQASSFNIRLYPVLLLQGLAILMPVWTAVLVTYVVSWQAIALAIYALVQEIVHNRIAASLAVPVVLVLTPQWTLGGNDLVHSMLVPSMMAWALVLWAAVFFLRKRWLPAALLLGLGTWMQALVGLQMAGILVLQALLDPEKRKTGVLLGAVYALIALPSLGPILYQQLFSTMDLPVREPSLFYIVAQFRNPHHYLPSSFPLRSFVRFGVLAAAGIAALFYLHHQLRRDAHRFILSSLLIVAALLLVGVVFTEVHPSLFVAKLQLFMTTVFARILLVALICGAIISLLPLGLRNVIDRILGHKARLTGLVIGAVLAVAGALWLVKGPPALQTSDEYCSEPGLGAVEAWVRDNTPTDAVFAIPPSVSSFRFRAQRAVFVNFKAFPYDDAEMYTWFSRIIAQAPVPLPERGGAGLLAKLDEAYERMPDQAIEELADRYGIDYFLRQTPLSGMQFRRVYTSGPWSVYAYLPSEDGHEH